MQLAGIVETRIILASLGDVRGGDGKLGGDLVQGMLRGRESELILEEGCLGGIPVGVSEVQALHRVKKLLSLLDEAGNIKHGWLW